MLSQKLPKFLLTALAVSTLAACTHQPNEKDIADMGDYWQRADTTSMLYMRGPKAQHQLHKDISNCTVEVRELIRLGSIREATPPDDLAMTGQMKSNWDTPRRDGPLHTEHLDFVDFETCMNFKGWQRVDYVHPQRAKAAADNYAHTIYGKDLAKENPMYIESKESDNDYDNFN